MYGGSHLTLFNSIQHSLTLFNNIQHRLTLFNNQQHRSILFNNQQHRLTLFNNISSTSFNHNIQHRSAGVVKRFNILQYHSTMLKEVGRMLKPFYQVFSLLNNKLQNNHEDVICPSVTKFSFFFIAVLL